jgi:hypothetical protein
VRFCGKLLTGGIAAMVGALALPVLATPAARADSTAPLTQLTSFHQILVDEQAGFVFLSEGQDSYGVLTNGADDIPGIVVTDLAGNYVTTIDAGMGADGMALSSDGSTLYAALEPDNTVAAIDVSSITSTTTTPAQAYWRLNGWEVPYSLAIQSGKLWVSYDPEQVSAGGAEIGYFDLSQTDPTFNDQVGSELAGTWQQAPDLSADPSDSGVLIASGDARSDVEIASWNVAGGTPVTVVSRQQLNDAAGYQCGGAVQTVLPGGGSFMTTCPSSDMDSYSTSDFTVTGSYTADGYTDAVATAPRAGLVAVGAENFLGPDIFVYQPGSSAPLNVYDFGQITEDQDNAQVLVSGGLAVSPDGSELYAVTDSINNPAQYELQVYDNPDQAKTSLTLNGSATGAAGGKLTMSGTLTLASGPAPANESLAVTRTNPDGSTTTFNTPLTTNSSGGFSFSDAPPTVGTNVYTVSLVNVNGAPILSRSLTVSVGPDTSAITVMATGGKKGVTVTGTLTFGGSRAPAGETITIVRSTPDDSMTPFTLPPVTTTSNGTFSLTDGIGQSDTYIWTATYAGDASHGDATATSAPVTVTIKR